MLRWLKIHRYRNVVPGTELRFSDGHHVLLGPNGGGKTTLLELIAAVLRGDFSGLKDEDFSLEYEILDDAGATMRLEMEHVSETSPRDPSAPEWRDRLTATLGHSTLGTKRISLTGRKTEIDGVETPNHEINITAPALHTLLSLSCWNEIPHNVQKPYFSWLGVFRFDEALSFFSFLRGHGDVGGKPFVRIYKYLSSASPPNWSASHPLFHSTARELLSIVDRPNGDSDRLTLPLSAIKPLNQAVILLGLASGVFRAELERQVRTEDQERLTYERFQFRFERRDGTMVLDEHLSFGQKRLLAFLFYAWANDGPIVADELVDGMHHRWVEHCLRTIQGRQAFLSSQNPLLMNCMGFDSLKKVEETFVICDLEERDGRELMRWRNLPRDEAGKFFRAYEAGIQHVSEILIDKGLW